MLEVRIERFAPRIALERNGERNPHDSAVFTQVTLLQPGGIDLARVYPGTRGIGRIAPRLQIRAEYVAGLAEMVANGEVSLERIARLHEDARTEVPGWLSRLRGEQGTPK